MICPIDTPSRSPWTIERTNDRIEARVATGQHVEHRLLDRETHGLFLEGQPELLAERSGEPRVRAVCIEPTNPSPASIVTTSRSISSGSV